MFEYRNEASAGVDVAVISQDARIINGEGMVWVAPPHFCRQGNLMVLYMGNDPATLSLTE